MATVTYKFDLHEERDELEIFQSAIDVHCALLDFANWMRGQAKHGDSEAADRLDVIEECQSEFWERLGEHLNE